MNGDGPNAEERRILDREDPSASLAALHRRARVEGDGVLLEPLALGAAIPRLLLEAAARVLAERLRPTLELIGVRRYEALCADRRAPPGRVTSADIAVFRHRRTDIALALIPARPGHDGSPAQPPFLLGRHPVTRGESFRMRAGQDPALKPSKARADRPVTGLTVAAMMALCGHAGLRLPTLAEWRHACAGGSGALHWWCADYEPGLHCTWSRANGHRGADDMRRLEPQPPALHDHAGAWNAFGLVDMVGNVHEACRGHDRDPEAWSACGLSVLMPPASGYDLLHPPILGPDDADIDLGFRVALDLPL